jgi:hypothetical protein
VDDLPLRVLFFQYCGAATVAFVGFPIYVGLPSEAICAACNGIAHRNPVDILQPVHLVMKLAPRLFKRGLDCIDSAMGAVVILPVLTGFSGRIRAAIFSF